MQLHFIFKMYNEIICHHFTSQSFAKGFALQCFQFELTLVQAVMYICI